MENITIIKKNLEIFEKVSKKNPSSQIFFAIRMYKEELNNLEKQK